VVRVCVLSARNGKSQLDLVVAKCCAQPKCPVDFSGIDVPVVRPLKYGSYACRRGWNRAKHYEIAGKVFYQSLDNRVSFFNVDHEHFLVEACVYQGLRYVTGIYGVTFDDLLKGIVANFTQHRRLPFK